MTDGRVRKRGRVFSFFWLEVGGLSKRGAYRLIVSVNLERRGILVVGGGAVAERKVRTLLGAGAAVTLVAPDATAALRDLAGGGQIVWLARSAEREDFLRHPIAILAVRREGAEELLDLARESGCLVDCCFCGELGDFALCAQFEMDGCYVGVSSGGVDPVRAAAVKREIVRMKRERDASLSVDGEDVQDAVGVLTRNSPLAVAQADMWIDLLGGIGVKAVKMLVTSHGDLDRKKDLAKFGGFGAFVKALEDRLLSGVGDCAVHSLKDMPVELPGRCVLSAVLKRASVYDVVVTRDGRSLEELPPGAIVGTSSLRRRAQVRIVRRDLRCVTCRGNVETRLKKLESGEVDALLLAEAGLDRLGMDLPNARRLPFVTAAGQGAVAIETVSGSRMDDIARSLNDRKTWYEITAERALLSLLGFGCICPLGVGASFSEGRMRLVAAVYSIRPMENPEDEFVLVEKSGAVASDEDARALAEALWRKMAPLPLVRELSSLCGGEARMEERT